MLYVCLLQFFAQDDLRRPFQEKKKNAIKGHPEKKYIMKS